MNRIQDLINVFIVIGSIYAVYMHVGMKRVGRSRGDVQGIVSLDDIAYKDGDDRIFLSILGEVYDVTSGEKYYGPSGGYHFFAGKDASRAFVSGTFEGPAIDDVLDLDSGQIRSIEEWRKFYRKHETYKKIGVLKGRYYDEQGQPTQELKEVERRVEAVRKAKKDLESVEKDYPGCSSRWSQKDGDFVWCGEKGPLAKWTEAEKVSPDPPPHKVPRKITYVDETGKSTTRCTCVEYSEEKKESPFELVVYDGCDPRARICRQEANNY